MKILMALILAFTPAALATESVSASPQCRTVCVHNPYGLRGTFVRCFGTIYGFVYCVRTS